VGYYKVEKFVMLIYFYFTLFRRVSVRQDTCCLVAVSLNVSQKVHPCIWTVTHLPHDCCKLLPVPKPIGGVLLMAQNSLLYLNQSVPPYAVALNSIARKATNFPLSKGFIVICYRVFAKRLFQVVEFFNYRGSGRCSDDFRLCSSRFPYT